MMFRMWTGFKVFIGSNVEAEVKKISASYFAHLSFCTWFGLHLD